MVTTDLDPSMIHIMDELERINILLSINLSYLLQEKNRQNSVSQQILGIPSWAVKKLTNLELQEEMLTLRSKIDAKIENSSTSSKHLRLLKLRTLFSLEPEEFDIFLICLIGELDANYHAIWADIQNDTDKIHPSIDIILNLLCATIENKLKSIKYFHHQSNLFKSHLLECTDIKTYSSGLTLRHNIKVSPRILNYLLGDETIIQYLSHTIELLVPSKVIENLSLPTNLHNQIKNFIKSYSCSLPNQSSYIITLHGHEGCGQKIIAESICRILDINMLIINIDNLLSTPLAELSSILSIIRREAILQNAAIYWQNTYLLSINDKNSIINLFTKKLSEYQGLHFFALNPYEYFPFHQIQGTLIHLEIPNLTTDERLRLWQHLIPTLPLKDITQITNSFQLGRQQIYDITTHFQALFRQNEEKSSHEEILQICHTHSYQHLSKYAKIIKPLYTLENIILPQECKQELEEIIDWIKYKEVVYEKSEFNKKVSLGKGLIALFYGSPGTGKTMAAEVIAHHLNLLLFKVDLSMILSKYVGETEQHLDKVFKEAESSNAILFFDEADSLFGKRGKVKDARDNYANMQTSYLLQKIEEYIGIVILSTNYKNNIDEAFIRRLHFSIDFPIPNAEQRYAIWHQIWPQNIQLDIGIDLHKLADKLDLTGGNIRNIALTATFKAANEQTIQQIPIIITKEHLIFAITREFKKIGRIIMYEQLNKFFE